MNLLVLGSGKMAIDIGAYFLQRGHTVTWMTQQADRLQGLERRVAAVARRATHADPSATDRVRAMAADDALPPFDMVLETTREDLDAKRRAVARAIKSAADVLVLSNSSSILPHEIVPECVGMHFFHPVLLTGVVEVIRAESTLEARVDDAMHFAREAELAVVLESTGGAFAANRLLLPLHAEAVRALVEGYPAALVDDCGSCDLVPIGPLRFMDAVGLDVIASAAARYSTRMPVEETERLRPLVDGLQILLRAGCLGDKNGRGFLKGSRLPWRERLSAEQDPEALRKRLRGALVDECRRFVMRGDITLADLDLLLGSAFGARLPLTKALGGQVGTA